MSKSDGMQPQFADMEGVCLCEHERDSHSTWRFSEFREEHSTFSEFDTPCNVRPCECLKFRDKAEHRRYQEALRNA